MMTEQPAQPALNERLLSALVIVLASVVAIVSARHLPTSWSDSSRVATVESLVDYHTLAIDNSVFQDTGDKIFVGGHFYSHKPPVPSLLMAAVYKGLQWTTGLRARDAPSRFYKWITIVSAGLAYVIAVWCVFSLGRRLGLPASSRLILTTSFAIATLALPYTRAVNEHILLLAVAMGTLLCLPGLAARSTDREGSWRYPICIGFLSGLGYAIEAGTGLPLLVTLLGLVAYRDRSPRSIAAFLLGALPWMALHHLVNYSIGGTFVAVAMVPELFRWPGSPFLDPRDLTGAWHHETFHDFVIYAVALLVGPQGFLLYNLPVWVAVAGVLPLLRRPIAERPEIVTVVTWSVCTWLLYAALSTNFSGDAVSIRWFVPLLAAGFYVLGLVWREYPPLRRDMVLLTVLGAVWALHMWRKGPWATPSPSVNWIFVSIAAASWCVCRLPWEQSPVWGRARRRVTPEPHELYDE